MRKVILGLGIFVVAFLILSCAQNAANKDKVNNQVTDIKIEKKSENAEQTMNNDGDMMKATNDRIAVVKTNKGTFKFKLYTEETPISTKNFIELAESKFYDELTFHRYVEGFVIQGGDPKGDGSGGSEKTIKLEIHPDLKHVKGAVGMARSQHPDSASSQFYVALEDSHFLDGNYAVFGQVTEGMDVVESLRVGDKMVEVRIE